MDDAFLTVNEVAAMLRLNAQTLRNWIDRGELPAVRVGSRRVRIRQSDLDAFLAAGTKDAAPPTAPVADGDASRSEFADSLRQATAQLEAGDDAELAKALRSVARAATQLARALERS